MASPAVGNFLLLHASDEYEIWTSNFAKMMLKNCLQDIWSPFFYLLSFEDSGFYWHYTKSFAAFPESKESALILPYCIGSQRYVNRYFKNSLSIHFERVAWHYLKVDRSYSWLLYIQLADELFTCKEDAIISSNVTPLITLNSLEIILLLLLANSIW